ncbi:MAG: hypothetical protein KC502_21460 [Myxococcales bacterium]|nr:hypothetical protein [Myxococcales bacterium]
MPLCFSAGFRSVIAIGLICLPSLALAGPWMVKTKGDFNARAAQISTSEMDVGRPLATDKSVVDADQVLETRLRLGGSVAWVRGSGFIRSVSAHLQADLFHGPQWQDGNSPLLSHDPLEARPTSVTEQLRFRRGFVQIDTTLGRLAAGRMVSTWGLGLLAQSGDPDPYQFGLKRDGVIVDRVQLASAPLLRFNGPRPTGTPLFFSIAADRVVFDDLANLADGDNATNLIAAILYRGAKVQAGTYAVMRRQKDKDGLRIDANAFDIFASWTDKVGDWKVTVATEWLMLKGETTYFRTATNPEKLTIDQLGGVVRATAERGAFGVRLEGGLASADDQSYDDKLSNLKFSREYRVGLAMFHEGLRRTSAVLAANLNDPRYTGQPPAGFERAATGGSVTGAIYAMPTVRYVLFDHLTVMGGLLWAQGARPLVDVYQSGLKGGAAIGPRGGEASTDLGMEVDIALSWRQPIGDHLSLTVRGDAGNWQPGAAFDDAEGVAAKSVMVWMGRLELQGTW